MSRRPSTRPGWTRQSYLWMLASCAALGCGGLTDHDPSNGTGGSSTDAGVTGDSTGDPEVSPEAEQFCSDLWNAGCDTPKHEYCRYMYATDGKCDEEEKALLVCALDSGYVCLEEGRAIWADKCSDLASVMQDCWDAS